MSSQSQEYRYRRAEARDEPRIQELIYAVLREHGLEPEAGATDSDLYDIESHYFAGGGYFEVVCEASGRIVATWGVMPKGGKVCELRKMYAESAQRGRGLGRCLVERALAKARELGFETMTLETAGVLQRAIKLYQSFGFQRIEQELESGRCDVAMRLDLSASQRPSSAAPKSTTE